MEIQCDYRFVWSKEFEKKKEGQWVQKREIRTIWPLRNLKPLFDEKGNDLGGPQVHANGWFWKCIYHSIYVCFMFWLSCALIFSIKASQLRYTNLLIWNNIMCGDRFPLCVLIMCPRKLCLILIQTSLLLIFRQSMISRLLKPSTTLLINHSLKLDLWS